MRRRVYAAFDLGLRSNEMLRVQLKHVEFKPVRVEIDGKTREVLVIALPPQNTKGGKTTGEIEHVYVGTERLKKELTARRFALKKNPEAFVFGTQDGGAVKGLPTYVARTVPARRTGLRASEGARVAHDSARIRVPACGEHRRPGADAASCAPQGPPNDAGVFPRAELADAASRRTFESLVVSEDYRTRSMPS